VELLKNIDCYERSKLADTLKEERYTQGEFIIREGEQGDSMYFVLEGEVVVTKDMKNGHSKELKTYSKGGYFGELALLNNTPRAASVVASSGAVKVLNLDRKTFMRLVGPLDSILKRNIDSYSIVN
jgi:cAMP-dependent protein kinase regulator